ncbi:hypothetical protein CRG98_037888 [Punica granatum]|uniref:Uncharacterized protein n=1 Tax=Punica granatum TaxID=22663 RepID=A0A2I0ICL5_PUNGR|nr:hypothetical protein CRG98_037888 [Punica granatum]
MERRLCTVDRSSDRDHLFTGEGGCYEEPFERDGMTRQSRGAKWHVWRARLHPASVLGSRFFVRPEHVDGDFKWKN